ncbi:MAG: leucine-rich repeat domain-containing protein, partial [Thiothrix litoralis]|uniref:leucine-rich repeat domain-containing protein n=1 Tax=Thiothrix litoralis TaxID=2891210 RepID=UPI003C76F8A8
IDPMLADCFGAYIPSDADLQAMTSLNSCSSKNLTDISALPFYFPKLQSLFLGGNAITDYTPLQNLPNLTGLSLEGNNLDMNALEVLSGLHNMQVLELDKCQLDNADVARLSSLTKLYHLVLSDNQMTDISALSGLTGLVVLKLDKNAISDLTPLSGMYRLSNLSLSSNRIAEKQASNLTILSGKTTLSYLEIDDNALSNVSALVSLTNVKTLALRNNRLLTADALKSMSQSLALYVAGNCLSGTALSGWPTNITLDTAGAQRSAVNGVCPAYTP